MVRLCAPILSGGLWRIVFVLFFVFLDIFVRNLFMLGLLYGSHGIVIMTSSVFSSSKMRVLDSIAAKALAVCPFLKRVLWNRCSSLDIFRLWNLCTLSSQHCPFHGRRYKFRPCFGGCRIVWACPQIIGLPDLES